MQKTLEEYINRINAGHDEEPSNSLGDPLFGWEHEINDFKLDLDIGYITLEPVVYTISKKKTILLEIWTELFEWFPEPGSDGAYSFLDNLENEQFLKQFIQETKEYHNYSDNPKEEIQTIYKLWKYGSSGQIILDDKLKKQALDKLTSRLPDWKIIMLQDYSPYLELTDFKTRDDYIQDLGF